MYNFRKKGGTRGRKVTPRNLQPYIFDDPLQKGRKYKVDSSGGFYYVD